MFKFRYVSLFFSILLLLYACSTRVAGGSDEQTNTIAGMMFDPSGIPVSGVEVSARKISIYGDTGKVFADTTSNEGFFSISIEDFGEYGISAATDSFAFYQVLNYTGDTVYLDAVLKQQKPFWGTVSLREGSAASSVQVMILGSPWKTTTDSSGNFKFEQIPEGDFAVAVLSPDSRQFSNVSYLISVLTEEVTSTGPFDINITPVSELKNYQSEICGSINLLLPLSSEYGLSGWWPMDVLVPGEGNLQVFTDARSLSGSGVVYGNAFLEEALSGKALVLKEASDFGVVENDRGVLDHAEALTVEVWVYVDSLNGTDSSYRKNIVGKLGFGSEEDQDVFSLAVIENTCGVEGPSYAFFLADGSGTNLNCENAVIDSFHLKTKEWVYLTAVWNGQKVRLYRDGVLVGEKPTSIQELLPSAEPLFFGKEDLSIKIDDVRWSTVAIDSIDVIYRYHQGGVQ